MKCSKSYSVVSFTINGTALSELIHQLKAGFRHWQKNTLSSSSQTVTDECNKCFQNVFVQKKAV